MLRTRLLIPTLVLLAVASNAWPQLASETVVRGLRTPVAVVADPTDRSRLLIVEQGGLIRVALGGVLQEANFLDLRNEISTGGERGLLGLALAPDYPVSRRFYVNFTNRNGDTVIARFLRAEANAHVADPASRFDLRWPDGRRVIEQPFANHNGGHLAFGPDGYLYVGLGDGGSGGDPLHLAQNPQTLLGKMLRLDVSVPAEDERGYRVPEDNPFADREPVAALPEIWSFGWRNPWRYSFDDWTRGGTAALVIADVGQDAREELNFEPAGRGGRNYGWRLREGRQTYDTRAPAAFGPLSDPMHDYGRALGASVTGGVIYRGTALDPSFDGRYFYADFISGRTFSIGLHLHPLTSEASADDEREHTAALGGRPAIGMVSSFASDHDGEMLLVNSSGGTVVRVVPDPAVAPTAPAIAGAFAGDRVMLRWSTTVGSDVASWLVERRRAGAVVERLEVERAEIDLGAASGDCFGVRGRGRSGVAGPLSPLFCAPPPLAP